MSSPLLEVIKRSALNEYQWFLNPALHEDHSGHSLNNKLWAKSLQIWVHWVWGWAEGGQGPWLPVQPHRLWNSLYPSGGRRRRTSWLSTVGQI